MQIALWLVGAAVLGLCACGGRTTEAAGGVENSGGTSTCPGGRCSGAGVSSGGSGSGAAPGSGGSTSGSGGASSACGRAGGPFTGTRSVTLETDEFVVPQGGEIFKCQTFCNPFGVDVEVLRSESQMAPGSHHLIVFFEGSPSARPAYDCGGLEFGERLHGAQTPEYVREYPEGVGMPMGSGEGLRFNMHYLMPRRAGS